MINFIAKLVPVSTLHVYCSNSWSQVCFRSLYSVLCQNETCDLWNKGISNSINKVTRIFSVNITKPFNNFQDTIYLQINTSIYLFINTTNWGQTCLFSEGFFTQGFIKSVKSDSKHIFVINYFFFKLLLFFELSNNPERKCNVIILHNNTVYCIFDFQKYILHL